MQSDASDVASYLEEVPADRREALEKLWAMCLELPLVMSISLYISLMAKNVALYHLSIYRSRVARNQGLPRPSTRDV